MLNGYLEILRLKRAEPEIQEKYIRRCLEKAGDIKALTDRMFDYALVYEEEETAELKPLSVSVISDCLRENCDFIRIAGFTVSEDNRWEEKNSIQQKFQSDEILIKRIFSNLFSNILKYGDKRDTVSVKLYPERGSLRISIQNRIRENAAETESTRIGLRSARRMVELHHGELYTFVDTNIYHVCITFNMIHKSSACSV